MGSPISSYDLAASDVDNWVSVDVTGIVRSWVDYDLSGGTLGLAYYGFLIDSPAEILASDGDILRKCNRNYLIHATNTGLARPVLEHIIIIDHERLQLLNFS